MLADFDAAINLPEAACSTNAYVEIAGVKHQITARGLTAAEMTTNYFAAVDTLAAAYEARSHQRVAIDAGKLLALVACWMKRVEELGDWSMTKRLMKAAQLVQAGAVTPYVDGTHAVSSQTDDQVYYWVKEGSCPCEDYQRHVGTLCKHGLSVALYTKLTAAS